MKKLTLILIALLVLALVVTAVGCGGDDDEKTTPTPAPTITVEPTATATGTGPSPTATPEPPAYTGGEHTFKFSTTSTLETLGYRRAEYLDERLRYYTDGKVKLQIYPGGSLYGAYEMYDALATGALDMAFMSDYQFMMNGFTGFEMFWLNCWWGETMEEAGEHNNRFWAHPDGGRKLFAEVGEGGVKMLTNLPSSNEQWLINDFEMKSLWDMKGKKIAGAPGLGGLFVKRTEGIVAIIDPVEFTIAFSQGLVDIYPSGAETVMSMKLHEIACCSFVVDVLNVVTFISMNMDLWDSLEPELQDIIENKVAPDVVAWSEVEDPLSRAKSEQEVEDIGHTVYYVSQEERLDFRQGCWDLAQESGLLDQIDQDLLKVADRLRNEPYDQGEFFP